MKDKIYILDGSRRLHIANTRGVLAEINGIRPIHIGFTSYDRDFVNSQLRISYDETRAQVDAEALVGNLWRNRFFQEHPEAGKIVLFDEDLFSSAEPNNNWVFGGLFRQEGNLGTIVLSTARMKDEIHARDVIRHEVGHMFGAPSYGRRNTYECMGNHCSDPACVMHQRLNAADSYTAAFQREQNGRLSYCNLCQEDIRGVE